MATTDSAAPTATLSIPEMLRIMDVATALRQDRELVESQLEIDQIKQKLREKLLASAQVTGEAITPEEVDAAIERYYASQNTYRDPPLNFEVAIAHLYVRRWSFLTIGLPLIVAIVLGWWLFVSTNGPYSSSGRTRRALAALTTSIRTQGEAIRAISRDPSATAQLDQLLGEAVTYEQQRDRPKLTVVDQSLNQLRERLETSYTVQVVANPNEKSGFPRTYRDFDGNDRPGYYLIVQALNDTGQPQSMRIHDQETGQDRDVTIWAEQVPKAVYDRLLRDKKEDGILNETEFAVKQRGQLEETVTLPGPDGQPLSRLGQITEW